MESVTGLFRHRTLPALEGEGGKQALETAPLIFFSWWPDSVSANVKLSSDSIWLL